MKTLYAFLILLLFVPCIVLAQEEDVLESIPEDVVPDLVEDVLSLDKFEALLDGIWLTEGKWENGVSFKQEIDFSWGLNKKIVKVKTFGTIDHKTKEYGLRNEGIRSFNADDSIIKFWEFDVFGGVTEGICFFEDKDLHYKYEYKGEMLRESWIFIDENNYKYKLGRIKGDTMDKVYMESSYKRIKK